MFLQATNIEEQIVKLLKDMGSLSEQIVELLEENENLSIENQHLRLQLERLTSVQEEQPDKECKSEEKTESGGGRGL